MAQVFQVHFRCNNQGDGSVRVDFHQNKEVVEQIEENENETGEGWAESSVDTLKLKMEDGKLYFRVYEEVGGKYGWVWKEAEVYSE